MKYHPEIGIGQLTLARKEARIIYAALHHCTTWPAELRDEPLGNGRGVLMQELDQQLHGAAEALDDPHEVYMNALPITVLPHLADAIRTLAADRHDEAIRSLKRAYNNIQDSAHAQTVAAELLQVVQANLPPEEAAPTPAGDSDDEQRGE